MTIATVTMVSNEADIIEMFVRHHARIADRLFVILHGVSEDGMEKIVDGLVNEGLPIVVSRDNTPSYQQSQILTRTLQDICEDCDPDILLPLDADEFVCCDSAHNARDLLLQARRDQVTELAWRTYVPLRDAERVIDRMTHRRRSEQPPFGKVVIPRPFCASPYVITQGSHALIDRRDGQKVPAMPADMLWLAHLPVRSPAQILGKILRNWPRQEAVPNRHPRDCEHWKHLYDRFQRSPAITRDACVEIAATYASSTRNSCPALMEDPLATYCR